jgi:hypothetical protein
MGLRGFATGATGAAGAAGAAAGTGAAGAEDREINPRSSDNLPIFSCSVPFLTFESVYELCNSSIRFIVLLLFCSTNVGFVAYSPVEILAKILSSSFLSCTARKGVDI